MTTVDSEIEKTKKKLIRKAEKTGLYENFGETEARKLREKFPVGYMGEERKNMDAIEDFEKWAMTFDDRKLAEYKKHKLRSMS